MKSHASMNRIYRLVWNAALSLWVAVAENAKGMSKGGSACTSVQWDSVQAAEGRGQGGGGTGFRLNTACRAALVLLASLAVLTHEAHAADAANASVSTGAGTVSTVGNTTTINQASQRLAIDWTSLSTRANEALVFSQPNAASIALNRITGSSPSELLGSLTANGQVFILNPNGVLFGAGSQVNVGGLVASTLNMSNADFMAGNNVFTGSGGSGSVVNQGALTAASGGYLALLAPEVRNEGVMTASLGTALLAAGNKVTLNLDNGSLLGYSIDQGAINALAENRQLIKADGGQVLLSAKAMDSLTTATVNNTGVIEARTLQNKAGRILLMGDMETGTVNVGGMLDAGAPNGGDGGFIETSAAHVKIAAGTRVTTKAPQGKTGKWLIDPNDFTVAASGGDMTGADVSSNLDSTNFEIATATMGTGGGNGDIFVSDALSWGSANTLTLTAERNIAINSAITTPSGGLAIYAAGNISAPAAVSVGTFDLQSGTWSQVAGSLPTFNATDFRISGGTFIRALGGDGTSGNAWQLSDVYGLQGAGSAGMLDKSYVLANNVDAIGTLGWNAGAGFKPIGTDPGNFTGNFDGQGHTISNLTINRPTEDNVGLFGSTGSTGTVANVGLVGGSVSGHNSVGALVGFNNHGSISNSYTTGAVMGAGETGGLAGRNLGGISDSHATGAVTGGGNTGGLVGVQDDGSISNSYATGEVRGSNISTGGLVGRQRNGSISNSYATGGVAGTYYIGGLVGLNEGSIDNSHATGAVDGEEIGGLVGYNSGTGTISRSHASGEVTSSSTNAGGLVGDNDGNINNSHATGVVTGAGSVGGLVGYNNLGSIANSYASGTVTGYQYVGGLVGGNSGGGIVSSYGTGTVTGLPGGYAIGGLVGFNSSSVADSYATGAVTGGSEVGGLVGSNYGGSIANSYATGAVMGSSTTGGLVGSNFAGSGIGIDNSFWDIQTSGQPTSDGGTGKTSAEMMQASTFTGAGWSASNVGGDGTTWRIYEGQTRPLLRSFLTALNLAPVYDGSGTALGDIGAYTTPGGTDNTKLLGAVSVPGTLTLSSSGAAGNYIASASVAGYYSAQDGYDIYSSRTIATAGSTAGDVRVDNNVTWTSGTLNINAAGSVDLNGKNFNGGAAGTINFNAGAAAAINNAGSVNVGTFNLQSGTWSQVGSSLPTFSAADFRISGGTFIRALGGDGTSGNAWQLSDVYGLQGAGSAGMLNKFYVLANNVDASGTAAWNAGAGFKPIGYNGDPFAGGFDGQGHTISNLTINRPGEDWVGLFGVLGTSRTVANVGLTGASVAGRWYVGGLVGRNIGHISNSYTTGTVTGGPDASGGLVGENLGSITDSYATGGVTGEYDVGGLAGINYGSITNSYATGAVTATGFNGGLVGWNAGSGSITNSYATGAVTGSPSSGGLVGVNQASIANSFWDTQTSGQSTSDGGTGKTSAEMMQASTFTGAGWSASNVGGDGTTWRVYEGQTGPLLRSFLTGLSLANTSVTYNGNTQAGVTTATAGVSGSNVTARNAGSYRTGYYSNQQGYDIIGGGLDIAKADLTLSTSNVTKTYDGTLAATGTAVAAAGTALLGGDTASGGSFAFTDKNAGAGNKTVTTSGVTVNDGNGGNNYNISYVDNTASTINKADLTVTATGVTKTYDGTTSATGTGTVAALAGAGAGEVVNSSGSQAFLDKNFGIGNKTVRASGVTIKDSGNADVTGNYNIAYVDDTTSTINKANVTLSTSDVTKTYDGTTSAAGTTTVTAGTIFAGDSATGGTFAFTDKNVGNGNKTVTTAGVTVGDGVNNANYNLTYADNTTSTISQANVTVTATGVTKTYDGTLSATGTGSVGALAGAGAGEVVNTAATQVFTDKNAGSGNKTVQASGLTIKDSGNVDVTGNYNISYVDNTTSTINKADLTVTATGVTKTYDGTTSATGTGTVAALAGAGAGEVVNSSGSQAFLDKNFGIGNKTVRASGVTIKDSGNADVTGNYNIAYVDNTTSTIDKADLTLSTSNVTKTYDGGFSAAGTVVVTSGTIFAGDSATGGTFAFTNRNVGNGIRTVTTSGVTVGDGVNNSNYNVSYADNTSSTINKANLVLTTGDVTKTYDGTTSATGSAQATGGTALLGGDLVSAGTFAFTDKNAGTGNKTVTTSGVTVHDGNSGNNYNITYADNTTSTINKANVTLSTSDVTKTYDGGLSASGTVVVTAGTVFTGDSATGGTFAFTDKNAGSGNKAVTTSGVTVGDGVNNGNYNVSYADNTTSTINKANVILSTSDVTKTYDGGLSATGTVVVTAGTVFAGDSATGGTFAFTDKNAGAGNKAVTTVGVTVGDGVNNGNYNVSYADNTTSTINQANLTVSTSNVTKTYDGNTSAAGVATVTGGTLFTGDSLTGGSFAFTDKNAGNGNKTVTTAGVTVGDGVNNGNYNVSYADNTTSTINPFAVSVSGTRTYDGTANVAAGVLNIGPLVGSETLGLAGTATVADKNVGANKTLAVGGLSLVDGTGLASNYTFTGGTQQASITQASITVGTSNVTKTYDGNLSAAGTATVTAGTLFAGDSLTGGSFAFTDKNAGAGNKTVTTSGVTVGDGVNNGNYAVTYANNTTSTINRADLTVTASGVNKVYDGSTDATVGYGDNRMAGDALSVTGAASFADKNAGTGKAVGVNGIALSGTDAGNYNLMNTTTSTTASITPKALTVTANSDTKLYDGSAYSGGKGVSYSGFVAVDSQSDIGGTLAYGGSSQGAVAAGNYVITPGGLSSISGNYALGFVDGALSITTSNVSTAALGNAGLVSPYDAALQAVAGLGGSAGGGAGSGGAGGSAAADALAAAAAEADKTGEE